MKKIKEDFLYYIWTTKQFELNNLLTLEGESVEIIDFGLRNSDSGPDFRDGKIKIGDTVWAGNVEMHIFSSEWEAHKHQYDDAYTNVILHVVYEHDKPVTFSANKPDFHIPTISLKKHINTALIDTYAQILEAKNWISCERLLNDKHLSTLDLWKYNLTIQRLWQKTNSLDDMLGNKVQDWEEVFYIMLCRYFGATANTIPFEQLALACPIKLIYKNQNNPLSIAALLFGQAGFLQADFKDEYYVSLKQEYHFLSKKYKLTHLDVSVWKFGGMMPPGFPTYRLAQLTSLLVNAKQLFSKILETKNLSELYELFETQVDSYWSDHYTFKKVSKSHNPGLTKPFIERLLINAVIPSMFLYGKKTGNEKLVDNSIELLESIPSENNSIIKNWKRLGVEFTNAFDTQAFIQLKKTYCDHKKCTQCKVAHSILKNSIV